MSYVFNRNVIYGVDRVHTQYFIGNHCPEDIVEEMKKLGYVSEVVVEPAPIPQPKVSERRPSKRDHETKKA